MSLRLPAQEPRLQKEKIRVYSLARELDMESKDLLDLCRQAGMDVKNQLSSLDPEQRDQIVALVKRRGSVAVATAPKPQPVLSSPPQPMRNLTAPRPYPPTTRIVKPEPAKPTPAAVEPPPAVAEAPAPAAQEAAAPLLEEPAAPAPVVEPPAPAAEVPAAAATTTPAAVPAQPAEAPPRSV